MQQESVTKKRARSENWTSDEKDFLRELIQTEIAVVENRGNDIKIIQKKNEAWKRIESAMTTSGFNRNKKQIKDQWMRMKLNAKGNISEFKRKRNETGNKGPVEEPEEIDWAIQDMIPLEFVEDNTTIDSNTTQEKRNESSLIDIEVSPTNNTTGCRTSTPSQDNSSSSKVKAAVARSSRNPNPKSILEKRNTQIEMEMQQSKELFELKMKIEKKKLEKIELEITILKEKRNEEKNKLQM